VACHGRPLKEEEEEEERRHAEKEKKYLRSHQNKSKH
jgi:hypothetical protein